MSRAHIMSADTLSSSLAEPPQKHCVLHWCCLLIPSAPVFGNGPMLVHLSQLQHTQEQICLIKTEKSKYGFHNTQGKLWVTNNTLDQSCGQEDRNALKQ